MEEFIITNKLNAHIDPHLAIWEWQVPVYLFLGGLSAGLLILGALSILRHERQSTASKWLLAVPVILSLGMFALFLDLEHKLYVWRFYTAFRPTAPMSWGSWILILVIPVNLLLVAATLKGTWPAIHELLSGRNRWLDRTISWSETYKTTLARVTIGSGIALGIYTGILLSAYVARPFWNTSILGLLFLVSGASSAAALVQLTSRQVREQHALISLDIWLIVAELSLLFLMILALASGAEPQRVAAGLVLGGPLTPFFWIFVLGIGLLLPITLEMMHIRGKSFPAYIAPVLVLLGGLIFRFFMVEAGQITTWIAY